jgi:hypothetical protein
MSDHTICPAMSSGTKKEPCIMSECVWWLPGGQPWNVIGECAVPRLALLVHRAVQEPKPKDYSKFTKDMLRGAEKK